MPQHVCGGQGMMSVSVLTTLFEARFLDGGSIHQGRQRLSFWGLLSPPSLT
ncbi:hypothetical protein ACRRTK_004298 [Alexandromys fortis]